MNAKKNAKDWSVNQNSGTMLAQNVFLSSNAVGRSGQKKKPRTFLVSRGPPTNPHMGYCRKSGVLTREKRKKKKDKAPAISHPSFPFPSNFFILPCTTPKQQTASSPPVSTVFRLHKLFSRLISSFVLSMPPSKKKATGKGAHASQNRVS
jgi:hypothetical protein